MEIDHLIPKSLEGDELAKALQMHGLLPDYDLDAEENLAPPGVPAMATRTSAIPLFPWDRVSPRGCGRAG